MKTIFAEQHFRPLQAKTFETAMSTFLKNEFPVLGGPLVRDLFISKLKDIIEKFYPPVSRLKMGQLLWFAVAKDETPGYGKKIEDTRFVPVILSLVTTEDIQKLRSGVTPRYIRKDVVVRMHNEANSQGGTLTEVDTATMLGVTHSTISKCIGEYEKSHGVTVPRRGTIHDLGPSVTHKSIICRKSVIEKKQTPDIAKECHHSTVEVDRYLKDMERVQLCLKKGLTVEQTSYATQMGKSLVQEYKEIIEDLNKTMGGE